MSLHTKPLTAKAKHEMASTMVRVMLGFGNVQDVQWA